MVVNPDITAMDVVGIDKARSHLADLVQRVAAGPILITRNGEAAAVLVDPDDYRALAAWAEVYANPEFHRQMAEVARSPRDSIADDDLDREVESIRRQADA
jgi:prevent-host-death family protein